MNMHDPIAAARLALLPFALVQWTVVFVYVKLLLRPEIATPMRVILLGPFMVAMVGTVFGQLNVYTAMTRVANPLETDGFVVWLVVIENLLAAALLVRMVVKNRAAPRGHPS
jgi:hypothetical protein